MWDGSTRNVEDPPIPTPLVVLFTFKFDGVAGRAHPDQRRQNNFSSYVDLSTKIIQQMRFQRRWLLTRQMRGTWQRNQRRHNASSHPATDDRSFLNETFNASSS